MGWKHKKYGKKTYIGKYERDADGERVFTLRGFIRSKGVFHTRKITFESWQAAEKAGWKRL